MTTPCSGRSPVWDWQSLSPGWPTPHLPPGQVAAAGAICAGFALLPDIDEPGSTVSRKLGPVSEAVAAVTNKLAGGHRQATHSLWFAGGTAVLVWWLGRFALAAPILVYACLALTLTMLVPAGLARRGSTVALIGPVAAGWAVWRAQTGSWLTDPTRVADPHTWAWLPVAAGTGVVPPPGRRHAHCQGRTTAVAAPASPCGTRARPHRHRQGATARRLPFASPGRPGLGRDPPSPAEHERNPPLMLPDYRDILDAAGRQPDCVDPPRRPAFRPLHAMLGV